VERALPREERKEKRTKQDKTIMSRTLIGLYQRPKNPYACYEFKLPPAAAVLKLCPFESLEGTLERGSEEQIVAEDDIVAGHIDLVMHTLHEADTIQAADFLSCLRGEGWRSGLELSKREYFLWNGHE
jgi:hypothetical protein